jgi:hypothetical protein
MGQNVKVAELNQALMRLQGRAKRRGDLQRQLDDIAQQQVGKKGVLCVCGRRRR